MKIVCIKCKRFFKPLKNGVYTLEQMPMGRDTRPRPGTLDEHLWNPYKLWRADLLQCEGCENKVVSGFACQAMLEHFEPEFNEVLKEVRGSPYLFTVNDCC